MQTRSQRQENMASPQPNGHATPAGRRMSMSEAIEKIDDSFYKQENIFLFVPNLIGEESICCHGMRLIDECRLQPDFPRFRFSLLHAHTSSNMFPPLQHIMPPRCSGRHGRTKIQPVDPVRRSAGHGDRQMHNYLLAGLPGSSISSLEYRLPRPNQS